MTSGKVDDFDVVVVGAGCFGTACARHLTRHCKNSSKRTCLIGPSEPKVARRYSNRSVFGSHYDRGRITRPVDPDCVLAKLAQRSIKRYREIEEESNINYYHEVGFLAIDIEGGEYITKVLSCCQHFKSPVEVLNSYQLQLKFAYLSVPSNFIGVYECDGSGYLDIRQSIEAQIKIANQRGCCYIDETVESINKIDGSSKLRIVTDKGKHVTCSQVVLATGAFTICKDVIRDWDKKLDIKVKRETVVKMQVNNVGLQKLAKMPTIIYKDASNPRMSCYILPPIKYEDGTYYVKIGHGRFYSKDLNSKEELIEWFHGDGDDDAKESLTTCLRKLIPHDYFTGKVEYDSCAITVTPHSHPMISKVNDNVTVLVGGNGSGAKYSDEVGNIGALTSLHESWTYDIPATEFAIAYQ